MYMNNGLGMRIILTQINLIRPKDLGQFPIQSAQILTACG